MIFSNKSFVVAHVLMAFLSTSVAGDDLAPGDGSVVGDDLLPAVVEPDEGRIAYRSQALKKASQGLKGEIVEKVVDLPWIVDVTVTFSDVGRVAVESYGYVTERGLSLSLISGPDVDAILVVDNWPEDEPTPLTDLRAVAFVADNLATELEETAEIDAANVAKANAVLRECRQSALLALSRPGKYELVIRTALRSVTNAPPSDPSWPRYMAFVSEEYFNCRLQRL